MGEMTREELAAMTDPELLAYGREHHGDPYMTLGKAKEMQRVALQFWHLEAAKGKADREAQEEARRRLQGVVVRNKRILSARVLDMRFSSYASRTTERGVRAVPPRDAPDRPLPLVLAFHKARRFAGRRGADPCEPRPIVD
jgi:hypothetical protein